MLCTGSVRTVGSRSQPSVVSTMGTSVPQPITTAIFRIRWWQQRKLFLFTASRLGLGLIRPLSSGYSVLGSLLTANTSLSYHPNALQTGSSARSLGVKFNVRLLMTLRLGMTGAVPPLPPTSLCREATLPTSNTSCRNPRSISRSGCSYCGADDFIQDVLILLQW